jgi:DNA-binding SARP family transcriptional activator/DNA-binding beta-propeller fold protein YncE
MPFRLVTLGELSLREHDAGRKLAIPRKALALMAVLASAERGGLTRERILSLLWPNAESSGRGALKQMIYELRQTLGNPNIIAGTAELALDPAEITSDAADLDEAYRGRRSSRVVELYAGPFLDQFHLRESAEFEHWLDRRREHYRDLFRKSLEESALTAEQSGNFEAAVNLWQRLSAEDPLEGRAAMGLINALDAAGNAPGALKHYALYARLLQDELGSAPDSKVAALAEEIRAGRNAALTGSVRNFGDGTRTDDSQVNAAAPANAAPPFLAGAVAPEQARTPTMRLPWSRLAIRAGIAALAVVAVAFAAAWRDRSGAHVLNSIEMPPNGSLRVTVDLEMNKVYADAGASFDNRLTTVDADSHKFRSLPHGSGVLADPVTHWYWSGDYGGRFVVVRNGRTDAEIGRIDVPGCPHQLAATEAMILVAEQCDDQISVIDARTRALIRNIRVATLSRAEVGGAKGMGEIMVNPNTRVAYFWKDMIPERLDLATWVVREASGFGGAVMAVDSANNRLYVRIARGLRVIDGATERALTDIELPGFLRGRVAVGFGGRRIYAATSEGLSIIDARSARLIRTKTFADGFVPDDVAVDDAKGRAYVLGALANGRRFLKIVDVSE